MASDGFMIRTALMIVVLLPYPDDDSVLWWAILPTFGEPVFILREISL
jgi:hypothetical protein